MPRVRVRMLRDTMLDGRPVRADSRQFLTQEEADFFFLRGYAKAEPLKPRRSKKGKEGHVDKKQKALDKLLAARGGDDSVCSTGSPVESGGAGRGDILGSDSSETSASASASAEAGGEEDSGLPEMPGELAAGVIPPVAAVNL